MPKMLKKVSVLFVLTVALTMVIPVISGKERVAQAGERIFPAWFFRSHSSEDKDLWGNRGVAPGGYIVGGPTRATARAEIAVTTTGVVDRGEVAATTHTVVKGESLWYIAGYKSTYGDPTKWPLIYKANRDKIRNPNLIYPGQVLRIPR